MRARASLALLLLVITAPAAAQDVGQAGAAEGELPGPAGGDPGDGRAAGDAGDDGAVDGDRGGEVPGEETGEGVAADGDSGAGGGPDGSEEQEPGEDDWSDDLNAGDVVIRERAERVFRTPGSVHVMDEEQLRRLDYNDPVVALLQVPGVYVRQEDGFGLRPNIGLRGASADRSRRVTLMEDGVLLAPAPYSAPAAYYFPLFARMTGVDVTMGPAAILYGPNTVGGAIDLRGRAIPTRREGRIDLSLGNTWYGRAHVSYGDANEWGGFLVEALHWRSSGFRQIDFAPRDHDTGFDRTDILARGELHGLLTADIYHRLELTVGLGLEQSNETYLGLSREDFAQNPYRRYAASQLDRMEWWRTRVQLRYEARIGTDTQIVVTAYRHDLDRLWNRLDRMCTSVRAGHCDGVGLDAILRAQGTAIQDYQDVLRGGRDTIGDERLLLVHNRRVFAVQGVQADGRARFVTGDVSHDLRVGARLHFDEITRDHTGTSYQMLSQQMVLGPEPTLGLDQNHASAWALAAYASWAVSWRGLTLTPGARTELIWMSYEDRLTHARTDTQQYAFLPGLGAEYALRPELAVYAGAHLGFSPVAPGQAANVLPETAWNYELGARYGRVSDPTHGQLTWFLSDYQNITAGCQDATSGGCATLNDVQFNGGAVTIMGIESQLSHVLAVDETAFPLRLAYTWTWSRFRSSLSDNPVYGPVHAGDQLPYVPEHQLNVQAGLVFRTFQINLAGTAVSAMRDVAGIGPAAPGTLTDAYFTLDANASLEILPGLRLTLRGENLTAAQPVVSYRPFGARSPRPVLVMGGFQIDFR